MFRGKSSSFLRKHSFLEPFSLDFFLFHSPYHEARQSAKFALNHTISRSFLNETHHCTSRKEATAGLERATTVSHRQKIIED